MMNFNEWKLIRESLQGSTTLGLGYPQTIGGVMGSHFSEGGFGKDKPVEDDDDEFDDEDDDDDLDDDDDSSDEGDEDLFGNSEKDTGGPVKNFPPEQGGGDDDFGDEEGDDDFLASIGAGAGGEEMGGHDDGMADLGMGGDDAAMGGPDAGDEPDMSFLDNIPDDLMGGVQGDAPPIGGDDAAMGHDAGGEMPCPDCNHEGEHDIGEDGCPTCDGEGFVADDGLGSADDFGGDMGGLEDMGLDGGAEDIHGLDDLGGDEFGGDDGDEFSDDVPHSQEDDTKRLMSHMQSYMKRYMQKEQAQVTEFAQAPMQQAPMQQQPNPQMQQQMMQRQPQQPMQQQPNGQPQQPNPQMQNMKKRMVKFMSKRGERSFMASDTPRQYMKKDAKKTVEKCCKEDNDFLNSLTKNMTQPKGGMSGYSEDALFNLAGPNDTYAQNDPQAGQTGFAPQGRVGSIGGGYTQDDFKDIPVLGESVQFPTLTEYAVRKARAAAAKKRK